MSNENKPKSGIWALFAKLGTKLFSILAKMLKALKFTKVGLAAVSFAGYAAIYSWKFALLLMVAVGFHESGHVWAMKKMGIKTKGFYFLPFIGGAAIAEEEYLSYGENAYVAIMGPVWGALMAWAAGSLYLVSGNPIWAAAAGWMAVINLFNLLPITPLDGGQLVRSIAFSIHKGLGMIFLTLSITAGFIIMWKLKIGLFALLLFVAGIELFFEVRRRVQMRKVKLGLMPKWKLPSHLLDENSPDGLKQYPNSMNKKQLALTCVGYVGTIALLVALLLLVKHVPGADLAANFLE